MERNPAISKGIDWLLVWTYLVLTVIGILSIFAATYREGDNVIQGFFSFKTEYSRQLLYFVIAAILSIMQKETGLSLVYFSFFLVMFREGLPAGILIIGFSLAVLVVATLLVEPDILAIILTGVAILGIYFLKRQIKRKRKVLFY